MFIMIQHVYIQVFSIDKPFTFYGRFSQLQRFGYGITLSL